MALPYAVLNDKKGKAAMCSSGVNYHCINSSRILDSAHTFCSPVFVVRFCEEEIPFNIIAQFRTEIDMHDFNDSANFFVETELLWSGFGAADTAAKAIEHFRLAVAYSFYS